ncbi:dihydroorotate dehydrogenase 2 [Thiobacillus denitrificans ATCC 25259]|uniref:Dihydroorotate dehydrogenase (quinone) n=1 Tax=Thiobacillus denitrificans (strain ATCC 25259 / T1) TaxID=292415 RepID=PYRD_THIDA|nr:quinone-dependent dihydroorotate dehydrogenase [Thiobacillus denitrificans]Q3SL21.1 RecName: Full=Dihydroorotate dehydrogenase (quinone); AltName: Full=DHOdehase; Short=DHOD; Short=DHODase; AltName: Full=Dihydroorotate oxidase [Thiobacillus denitrificans ATCC 25259]AAZ96598.1 dihydroorotate dehydrogenase 2 [Thiobacillus denitrificans ATCC 25259]
MLYSLIRPALFSLDAEDAHGLTLTGLDVAQRLGLVGLQPRATGKPVQVMGIDFPNAVGLAAGLDKDGAHLKGLAALGFGFLEIGTVTPRPQPGNPKPRLFRLPAAEGIINRMGFNNLGVDNLVRNVVASGYTGVLGINIGKNKDTPNERAADDYLACLDKVYAHARYVTVNISSPNTQNLRELQQDEALDALLSAIKLRQSELAQQHGRYVPIALKIAPDLDEAQIAAIAALLMRHGIDAVIATNTTIARDAVAGLPNANESGGLSGAPVREASTRVVRTLAQHLGGALPIIGVGGILSGDDARAKIAAGASLVQLYSGLIYRGPGLVRECVERLAQ